MAKRSKQNWWDLFEAHKQSGQTAAAFCREHGLCAKYFSAKQTKLGWRKAQQASAFVKAQPAKHPAVPLTGMVLTVGNCQLQLDPGIDTNRLSNLIKALA